MLCVANQKGGVGKTTTAVNLATGLSVAGHSSLLVDLDPRCSATLSLGQGSAACHPLLSAEPLSKSVLLTGTSGLDLLPGSPACDWIEELSDADSGAAQTFSRQLSSGSAAYDFVLIDCPPSLGSLTETALSVSTEVLMPIQCEYFAMEGLTQMIHVIRRVMSRPTNELQFGGILLTMYDHQLKLTNELDREVREFFGEIVFDTVIPRDVAVVEAPSHGKSVIDYSPRSRGTRAYVELCMEVLDRE